MPTGIWLYSYIALWLLLLLECGALVLLGRQVRRLHGYWIQNDPDWGLPLGSLAPALPDSDVYGRPVALASERGGVTAIFFLSPGCGACEEAMLRVPTLAAEGGAEVVMVVRANTTRARLYVSEGMRTLDVPSVSVLADAAGQTASHYKIVVVPYIVVVGRDGRIAAKSTGTTMAEMLNLLGRVTEPQSPSTLRPSIPVMAGAVADRASGPE